MRFAVLIITSCLISCQQQPSVALRSGYIIEQYRSAECLAPFNEDSVSPGSCRWDTTLQLADKLRIHIAAGEHVDGNVVVRFLPDGQSLTVVPPRDYVYPRDIRTNRGREFLYVKTDGLAAGVFRETWLYTYDLRQRKILSRVLVDASVLPSECASSP
jgi:hypothetical protein